MFLYTVSQYRKTWDLISARQKGNNLEGPVVVQELEFTINLALYGRLCSLGNQYIVGSLPWPSLTQAENLTVNPGLSPLPVVLYY